MPNKKELPSYVNMEVHATELDRLSDTYRAIIQERVSKLTDSLDFAFETIDLARQVEGSPANFDNRYHVSYAPTCERPSLPLTITDYVQAAHANAVDKGWWQEDRSFAECLALCHSELSEALEDIRNGKRPDQEWYESKSPFNSQTSFIVMREDLSDTLKTEGVLNAQWKPCGVPSELADTVIRIFDMAGRWGIDLERAIREKMAYNATRPVRHGGKVL